MAPVPVSSFERIVQPGSPYTGLQQRLMYMQRSPRRAWTNVVENVPCWPVAPGHAAISPGELSSYPMCTGEPALIEAIIRREKRLYGLDLTEGEVLVTGGALHAVSLIFRELARPGATVLCQAPVFTSIGQMFDAYGYRTRFFGSRDGELDADELRAMAREGATAIYVNTPNNPTGVVLSPRALQTLLEISAEYGLRLIVDMVYDSFSFDAHALTLTLLREAAERWGRVYTVNSLSKNYGSPGLRIGWILSAPENLLPLSGLLERECVAISGVSQAQAAYLLERGNAELVEHVRQGREVLMARLARTEGLEVCRPAGGTQAFVRLPVDDVEVFGDYALSRHGLALATRSQYRGVEGPFIRFPLGAPREVAERALELLGEALACYPGRVEPEVQAPRTRVGS
ncbi:beta-methylarginine biosynthesis bifunctional aminotransferase [Archangium violaceum]|uniref:beta-methylarginine biosynthesis bifunctional aminotransferase n=1 Tax=Archangium violaceum TaxID=83451 RepID=UPI0036D89750